MKYRWAFARKAEVSTVKMPENLTEVKLRQTDIYTGKILKLHIDDVRLPNGREAVREVVDHVDGAAVLALDEENRALVVWQYRYVFGRVMAELPAGKLDPGEDPVTGALRELKEELGISGCELRKIADFDAGENNGWEFIALYEGRYSGKVRFPAAEVDSVQWFTPEQIQAWVERRPQDFSPAFIPCWNAWLAANKNASF